MQWQHTSVEEDYCGCSCSDSTRQRRKIDAIENEQNTSAGDGGLCSGSIHRWRRTTADVLAVTAHIGGGR